MFNGKKPTPYLGAAVFRGGIEVDVPMQALRVREHCFGDEIETFKVEEVEMEDGGTVTLLKKETERRCPGNHLKCEIYQDHKAMGLAMELLPCCGAPVPGEVEVDGTVVDEIDLKYDIREIMQTPEVYPLTEGEEEKGAYNG